MTATFQATPNSLSSYGCLSRCKTKNELYLLLLGIFMAFLVKIHGLVLSNFYFTGEFKRFTVVFGSLKDLSRLI